ncbi:MAG: hypothetical protein GF364_14140 [Candidatus Lokiarchaeota archaeon]|nr:hypothetical protein [Candidatus Lokiarchaeota archaeon]
MTDNSGKDEGNWFSALIARLKTIKEWDKKTWAYVGVFMAIVLVTLYLYVHIAFIDPEFLFSIVVKFVKWVLDFPVDWVIPIIFVLFMGVQGLLMPIPSEIVLLMSGAMWGIVGGSIAGMFGSMFAAILCYWLAAKGGGPIVEKAVGKENLEAIDVYLQKSGAPVVFALRAFPLMTFDLVSYVSGLIKLDFWKYVLANLLGCITRVLFWAWLGNKLVYDTTLIYELIANPESPCYDPSIPLGLTGPDLLTQLSDECIESYISLKAGNFNIWIVILVVVTLAFLGLYNYLLIPYLRKNREKELASLSEEERKELLAAEKEVEKEAESEKKKKKKPEEES